MDLRKYIEDYLKEAKLIQLATVKDNKPWACSVWYVHDENLNLYFISRKNRRHSQELEKNPNVAGTITIPHFKGSGEKVRGLQFEGQARTTKGEEVKKASDLYLAKYSLAEKIPLILLKNPLCPYPFYIIKPSLFILFDEVNFPNNPRQEFKLENRF